MKKIISIFLSMLMMTVFATGCSAQPQTNNAQENAVIQLQVGNPMMTINGTQQELDPGRETVPIVENGRTLLPIRAVCEAMGAVVEWENETRTTIIAKGSSIILLSIDSNIAFVNEERNTLDTTPVIRNDRTMLPIRFIAENLNYSVEWEANTQTITLTPNEKQEEDTMTNQPSNTNPTEDETSKSIVVYFSQTGTTRTLALKIAELTGSDIYEIIPEIPYTSADIDYGNNSSRANREQNDPTARPAIAGDKIDISKYDTIYLGFPIWWGTNPRIINTFIDSYDLSGKTILLFCTSHSSGISGAVSAIKAACPDSDVKNGFRGNGTINEDEISRWLADNGILK